MSHADLRLVFLSQACDRAAPLSLASPLPLASLPKAGDETPALQSRTLFSVLTCQPFMALGLISELDR